MADEQAQVDRGECVDLERREVLLDARAQLLRALGPQPPAGVVALTRLGDPAEAVKALVGSIELQGTLVPVVVRNEGNGFELETEDAAVAHELDDEG